ncbi:MAG: DUF6735 family protein [Halobacteriales archaeon]
MGHRALLARERAGGRYDVYYSHWGGADLSLARDVGTDPRTHPQVDPDPIATAVAWDEVLSVHLDPVVHEALFVLGGDGDVAAYRPVPPESLGGPAVAVAVDPADPLDDAHARGWFAGARETLGTAIEAGDLEATAARTAYQTAVGGRFGDREVTWLDR